MKTCTSLETDSTLLSLFIVKEPKKDFAKQRRFADSKNRLEPSHTVQPPPSSGVQHESMDQRACSSNSAVPMRAYKVDPSAARNLLAVEF